MRKFTTYPNYPVVFADTYIYRGPVKHFENIIETDGYYETTADSYAKAISNIKFQAKRNNGFKQSAKITIDESLVDNVSQVYDASFKCPECHIQLTDGGYCPECGEYYGE